MRLLIENNGYAPDVTGGAELSVQGIAEELVRRGHDVSVLCAGREDVEDEIAGVVVYRRRMRALMSYPEHLNARTSPKKIANKVLTIDNPRNRAVFEEIVSAVRPQVLITNNLLGVTPELWRVAASTDVPIVHTTRDYSLLCPNSTLVCRDGRQCERARLSCQVMRRHLIAASRLVSELVAPSSYALGVHLARGYFTRSRACVIPNAIVFVRTRVEKAMRAREQARAADVLRLCYLGRLEKVKGVLTLLDALEELRSFGVAVRLEIAGNGPLEQEILARAQAGLDIHLNGFMGQDDLHELLMATDVLVAPSIYAETFGRVVLDAAAHAMPAIVSDAGALPEILATGAGTVVRASDSHALAQAISDYADDRRRIVREGAIGAEALLGYGVSEQTARFEEEIARLVR